MPIEVTMPKLSPTMESGIITQWLIKVGDQVKEGDALADIETDKATMQMKSYDDGIVAYLDHEAGAEVALGQRVLVLAKKGEDPKQVAASLGSANGQASQKAAPDAKATDEANPRPTRLKRPSENWASGRGDGPLRLSGLTPGQVEPSSPEGRSRGQGRPRTDSWFRTGRPGHPA